MGLHKNGMAGNSESAIETLWRLLRLCDDTKPNLSLMRAYCLIRRAYVPSLILWPSSLMPPRCFVGIGGIVVGIGGLSAVITFLGLGLVFVAFFLFLMSVRSSILSVGEGT